MNNLWSPWRMDYIRNYKRDPDCVFCREVEKTDSPENLIIFRASRTYVILNRYPYTTGHLMVVPYEHTPSLELLDSETRVEMIELSSLAIRALRDEYKPHGFNLGINIGEAAGAGIVEHVHFHVVPRWSGDTNFMSAVASVRVIPEALDETYWRIKKIWDEMTG
ncbi:MAG: HIT domain-containing protein [Anaerolineales bacterium]|nr:HIT domain-containing protein [Anaerolineales bacterium]